MLDGDVTSSVSSEEVGGGEGGREDFAVPFVPLVLFAAGSLKLYGFTFRAGSVYPLLVGCVEDESAIHLRRVAQTAQGHSRI